MLITVDVARQIDRLALFTDAQLTGLIQVSQARIERWCRRTFTSTANTAELYDGDGSRSLFLRKFPVTLISAIRIYDQDGVLNTTYTTVTPAVIPVGFKVNVRTGELRFQPASVSEVGMYGTPFIKGFQNISIDYTAGFSTIPIEVQEACMLGCSYIYETRKQDLTQSVEELGDFHSKIRTDEVDLPDRVKQLVASYRKHV
jgi:hypothetical protein